MHRVAIHPYPSFLNVLKTATEKDFILQSHPDILLFHVQGRSGGIKQLGQGTTCLNVRERCILNQNAFTVKYYTK